MAARRIVAGMSIMLGVFTATAIFVGVPQPVPGLLACTLFVNCVAYAVLPYD